MTARQFVVTVVSSDGMAQPTPEDVMRFLSSASHLRLDYGHHRVAVDTFPERADNTGKVQSDTPDRVFEVRIAGGPVLIEDSMSERIYNVLDRANELPPVRIVTETTFGLSVPCDVGTLKPPPPLEVSGFGTSKRRFEVVLLAPFLSEGGPALTEPIMAALTHTRSKVPNVLRVKELTHSAMPGSTGEESDLSAPPIPAPFVHAGTATVTPKAESVDKLMAHVTQGVRDLQRRSKAEVEGAFYALNGPSSIAKKDPAELLDWKRGYLRAKTQMEW